MWLERASRAVTTDTAAARKVSSFVVVLALRKSFIVIWWAAWKMLKVTPSGAWFVFK
jgi:hypothetical protein